MADEVFDGTDVVRQLFGEGQSVTDEAGDALPHGVIEALDMIGFAGVLRDGFVLRLCGRKIQMSLFRDYSIFTGFWYGSRGAFIV